LKNDNVPPLVPELLPKRAFRRSKKFLERWVMVPPTRELADHMAALCAALRGLEVGLPPCTPVDVNKVRRRPICTSSPCLVPPT
jgi:hypothetical protein